MKRYIMYIALVASVFTYLFWTFLPKGSFYIGNAIYIYLLTLFIFIQKRKSFIRFILLAFAVNNLLDELFFDNTKFQLNEIILPFLLIIIWKLCRQDTKRQST